MMMLDISGPNNIFVAIEDSVNQKADGLYDFVSNLITKNKNF